jgi:hypothetical protein
MTTLIMLAACPPKPEPPDGGAADSGVDAGPPGLTCGLLLLCDQPCQIGACTDACYAKSTAVAQGLFDVFTACLDVACQSACSMSSMACSTCDRSAATGACVGRLSDCMGDEFVGPENGDAGAIYPDAGPMDAGVKTNCGGLVACRGACAADAGSCIASCIDQSTVEAQGLANAVDRCLATTCPSTDGGPCAMGGSACTGCIAQAEFDNNTCGVPFTECQSDSSNSPDASVMPVALQGGTLKKLVGGLSQPQVVIEQQGFVYYSNITISGAVSRVSLADGGTTDLSPGEPFPMGLALDTTNIYVWNSGTFSGQSTLNNHDGTIVQIPLDGGTKLTLATQMEVAYAAPYNNAIAVDGKYVYWVAGASGNDGTIMKCPIGSATPSVLYGNQPFPEALATDGVNIYWSNWGTFDTQGKYNNDGTIMKAPVDGGTPVVLASGQSAPAAIAIDSANVYWTDVGRLGGGFIPAPNSGSVNQISIDGGSVVPLSTGNRIPLGIAVSGHTVYWDEYVLTEPGKILSAPVGGGGPVVPLVGGVANPFGIGVGDGALYWTSSPPTAQGSGTIWSLSPLP